ncbi:receptor-type tyrosine-protein phosphatase delta-like [Micropterus dolomieu]|uniref:receptor-type tyrosine-protein phosphatase delta-like n=1 Tax=Micropterus dolomieu TaxID=147949 RepID=UPI001E8EB2F0|nr:receptor-type tyrosine-protein phosphatase delta-like [Micropterus dolomieu]
MGPQLKVVRHSQTATMICAASGNPNPEITWFKDFLPFNTSSNNGRIKQLRSGALQIEMSEESDQGKYECVATNRDGTRYSSPANLYVRVRRVPPRISIPPANSEIKPGGNINISCVAVGSPMPYVKWMLGAENLTPEDDMPIGRNVLELTDVLQSNNYTCVAMSSLGVIKAVAQIIVKDLPNAPGTPVVTERTATSVTLTWDSGNPEPVSYYILQHRAKGIEPYKEINGITKPLYSVGGLSPYSHYDFRVAAVNTVGQGPSSEVVEVLTAEQAPSSPPRRVRGRMLSTRTAIIHWDEPDEPNGQVVGNRVYYTSNNTLPVNQWEKQIVRSTNFTIIHDLTPNKTYYIRVLAFTSEGDGPLSLDLQIMAKTGVPSQPSEFMGVAKSETSILLSWVAPLQGDSNNQITGYDLVYRRADDTEETKVSFEPTSSYLLKYLKPFSTYTFQLAAKSKHAVGVYTNEMSIDTPQTPRFTRTPEDQTGVEGGVASFVCQATGNPQPNIVWNKKGKKVSKHRYEIIEFDNGSGSVLRIQPLRTIIDEVIYECHASNSAGEVTASARLSVLREDQLPYGFPTIDMGPQLKVVEHSRGATMVCAARGNPKPEITWFKNFLPVNTSNNNRRIKQLHSGALQIAMSEESDQGKYECVATNRDGTLYSSPANLYVRVKMGVKNQPVLWEPESNGSV